MSSIYHYQFNFHYNESYNLITTDKLAFFLHVCQKFSLRVLFSFCLIFCQFQSAVAYKKKRELFVKLVPRYIS